MAFWRRAEGRTLSDMDRHRRFARAEDRIARLSNQGLDMVAFWRACTPVLQGHLRNVFVKAGARTRGDLVTKILIAHYEPRLLDDEQRTAENRSSRGGPR